MPAPGTPPEIPITSFGIVTSTMDLARDTALEAADNAPEPIGPRFFAAGAQVLGRGTHGRPWSSPPGGLWGTLLWPFTDPLSPRDQPTLGLKLGVATLRTVQAYLPHARLKWPNDILVNGRKIAGVLAELLLFDHRPPIMLVGVGINANNQAPALSDAPFPATSLIAELGAGVDVSGTLTAHLLRQLTDALTDPSLTTETLLHARAHLFGIGEPFEGGLLAGLDDAGRPIVCPAGPGHPAACVKPPPAQPEQNTNRRVQQPSGRTGPAGLLQHPPG